MTHGDRVFRRMKIHLLKYFSSPRGLSGFGRVDSGDFHPPLESLKYSTPLFGVINSTSRSVYHHCWGRCVCQSRFPDPRSLGVSDILKLALADVRHAIAVDSAARGFWITWDDWWRHKAKEDVRGRDPSASIHYFCMPFTLETGYQRSISPRPQTPGVPPFPSYIP